MSSPTEQDTLVDVQRHMESAVRAYGQLLDAGHTRPILADNHRITATDAVRAASALLAAVNLEVFELALWQSWGGQPYHEPEPGSGNA
jgi:hypothetical protein